jgi:hypothetical protein
MGGAHVHLVVNHVPVLGMLLGSLLLLIAIRSRERASWVRAALLILTISFIAVVAAFFSGEPALQQIEGLPRTSGVALSEHHVRSVYGLALSGAAAVAAGVAVVLARKRSGEYSRPSLAILLGVCMSSSLALGWTSLAGGRINHPELQDASDRDQGSAHMH